MSKPIHILIADDETNVRLVLHTALSSVGYEVSEATDGRAALDAISRDNPDVMILDLSMPALDGFGVLSELKGVRADRKPRVIVLTAYGSISAAVKATRLGAMDFLEKPVTPDEVREAVEAVLDTPLPRPSANAADGNDPLAGGYAGVLDRVRKSLRLAQYADAETLLMKAADLAHKDAAYFNLLGALYETQRQWRLAKKFYNKALSADKRYEPALQNLRRLYELQTRGATTYGLVLGDEGDVWVARLPEARV